MKALHRLTWAGKEAIDAIGIISKEQPLTAPEGTMPPDFIPFNELLSLGYFESSVINVCWHGLYIYFEI